MTASALPPRRPSLLLLPLVVLLLTGTLAFAGHRLWRIETQLSQQQATISGMLAEVTRMRLEQTSEGKGPAALLEKLRIYAPMSVDTRVAEPAYRYAKKEMDAVLLAFESLGKDAWQSIMTRLEGVDARKDHDEITWLLKAALRVDPEPAKQLIQEVLLGYRLPSPRLRWFAAVLLTAADLPMAQQVLRRILLTESSRGRNAERAAQYDKNVLDPSAFATTGFNNFVVHYIRTEDPQLEETLLMVMGRAEHDQITVKECVEELGRRKCTRATEAIERAYLNPPLDQQNPLFLNSCLDALVEIQGKAAKPFLEKALTTADSDVVVKHVHYLLNKIK